MLTVEEGVLEVDLGNEDLRLLLNDARILSTRWVSIAQEDVCQPVWDDCLLIHQIPDALQHSLEVVLLQRLPSMSNLFLNLSFSILMKARLLLWRLSKAQVGGLINILDR